MNTGINTSWHFVAAGRCSLKYYKWNAASGR